MENQNLNYKKIEREMKKELEDRLNRKRMSQELREFKGVLNHFKTTIRSSIKDVHNNDIKLYLIRSIISDLYKQVALLLRKVEVSEYLKEFCYYDCVEGIHTDNVLTYFNYIETLKGLLDLYKMTLDEDKEKDEELKRDAVHILLEIEKYNDSFVGERVDSFVRYLEVRNKCEYQDVIEFINENYSFICLDDYCMRSLNHLIMGYSKERINMPWYNINRIQAGIPSLKDEDFSEPKSKEMFIYMVNTAFKDANKKTIPEIKDEELVYTKRS